MVAERTATHEPERDPLVPHAEPGRRGVLVVKDRAILHLAQETMVRQRGVTTRPKVRIVALDDDGLDLDVALAIRYPDRALSAVIDEILRTVSNETARQLGRRVRSIDITVTELATDEQPSIRRVE